MRYTGKSPNVRTWKGAVTGIHYRFGPGDVRFVDKRDVETWLNPKGGDGSRVFEHHSSQDD